MNYKIKAFIQNTISYLPPKVSNKLYFYIQKNFGNLRKINPYATILRGKKIIDILKRIGEDFKDKRFIEIGTGRAPILPLILYLYDVKQITSIDLNPYLSHYVWDKSISWMAKNKEIIKNKLGLINYEKLDFVLSKRIKKGELIPFLEQIGIQYFAPCDASNLPFPDNSFDFHISANVFEHISKDILRLIMKESKRILVDGGSLVHGIDYSDHFSHSDHKISPINFLRFSPEEFKSLAGNRYMYMNRMRDDDFQDLFDNLEFCTIFKEKKIDEEVLRLLSEQDFYRHIHDDFKSKDLQCIANTSSWYALKY